MQRLYRCALDKCLYQRLKATSKPEILGSLTSMLLCFQLSKTLETIVVTLLLLGALLQVEKYRLKNLTF